MLSGCLLQKLPVAARYTAGGGGALTNCTLTDNAQGVLIIDGDGPRVSAGEE